MDEILVGVDGSEAAEHALRWAMEEARCHDAGPTAALVAEPAYLYGSELPYGMRGSDMTEEATKELEAIVAGVVAGLPSDDAADGDLALTRKVEIGDPCRVLRELSAETDLLVFVRVGTGSSPDSCSARSASTWSPTPAAP